MMRSADLTDAKWFKSSWSNPDKECVEVAFLQDSQVAVRDSKSEEGEALVVHSTAWLRFIDQVARKCADDSSEVLNVSALIGGVVLRGNQSASPALYFTEREWVAFERGVCDGEFHP